jgi:hypothetical protein
MTPTPRQTGDDGERARADDTYQADVPLPERR